jgi:MSV199 domain
MTTLNIVELFEKNPNTRLSGTYNYNLLMKIKDRFNETEAQLYLASFSCYWNYNSKNYFVTDFDNNWEWLGFSQKSAAKRVLKKILKKFYKDYKTSLIQTSELTNRTRGGNTKSKIMLNVKTFKLLCLKSGTKKADQIHEYYINLEETLQEVIHEESTELKDQLVKRIYCWNKKTFK